MVCPCLITLWTMVLIMWTKKQWVGKFWIMGWPQIIIIRGCLFSRQNICRTQSSRYQFPDHLLNKICLWTKARSTTCRFRCKFGPRQWRATNNSLNNFPKTKIMAMSTHRTQTIYYPKTLKTTDTQLSILLRVNKVFRHQITPLPILKQITIP